MSRSRATTAPRCSSFRFLLAFLLAASTRPAAVAAIPSPRTATLAFLKPARNNHSMAPNTGAAAANAGAESSSVLRELKGTVTSQAAEIARLKKALATKTPAVASGGHGHGPPIDNEDILQYIHKSCFAIAYERVGWLGFFLFTLSFTAVIMNGFEHTLSEQIELAYFVPLLAGHGGNTGGQAVGTVLSAFSAGVVTRKDAGRVIAKEALSGLVMGVILGIFVGPICHYGMGISKHVSTVVSVTMPLLSLIAAFLGSLLPFVCVVMGVDPAVIAAPAMTSLVDVTGLLCYFLIANKVFQLFGMKL